MEFNVIGGFGQRSDVAGASEGPWIPDLTGWENDGDANRVPALIGGLPRGAPTQ
jgi:hypothetical protein